MQMGSFLGASCGHRAVASSKRVAKLVSDGGQNLLGPWSFCTLSNGIMVAV
jgi:hypothetical protein